MHFTGHKSMLSIDLLLNQPLPLLILGVFIILAAASEIGFIAGRWIARKFGKAKELTLDVDNNVSTITNSSLALLALFLGFTFSSALDHFEKNREAVTNEATALTTAYHVIKLQPQEYRDTLLGQLNTYIDVRLGVAALPNDSKAIRTLEQDSQQQQEQMWSTVNSMVTNHPDTPMLPPLIDALNSVVTAEKNRTDSLINGVPNGLFMPVALFLLFNGVLMGVSLGEGARRHTLLSWGLYFLVALAVGIIVDLDRPLKGYINVDQQAMMILKDSLQ